MTSFCNLDALHVLSIRYCWKIAKLPRIKLVNYEKRKTLKRTCLWLPFCSPSIQSGIYQYLSLASSAGNSSRTIAANRERGIEDEKAKNGRGLRREGMRLTHLVTSLRFLAGNSPPLFFFSRLQAPHWLRAFGPSISRLRRSSEFFCLSCKRRRLTYRYNRAFNASNSLKLISH